MCVCGGGGVGGGGLNSLYKQNAQLLYFWTGLWSGIFAFLVIHTCYPPMTTEGYSFDVARASVHFYCPSGTMSQYLLVRFDAFFV